MRIRCPVCNKEFISKGTNKRCSKECSDIYKLYYSISGLLIRNDEGKLLCVECNSYKNNSEFYNRKDYKHLENRGFKSTVCKICQNRKSKKVVDRYRKTIEGTLRENLKRAKHSCKGRGLEYNIDYNYILDLYKEQDGKCSLSGETLTSYGYYDPYSISIDRIDSSKGYVKGNVHLVCWAVNQMKNDYTIDQLLQWCNYIVNYNKSK